MSIKTIRSIIITMILASFITIEGCKNIDQEENNLLEIKVVPSPNKVLNRGGKIIYPKDFWVIADVGDSATSELASYLANSLKAITGQGILITDLYSTRNHNQSITIKINNSIKDPQAYTLDLTSAKIKIEGGGNQGIYYGIKTLLQILNSADGGDSIFIIPKVIIKDSPNNKVRAVLVSSDQIEGQYSMISSAMGLLKLNKLIIEDNLKPESESELNRLMTKNFVQVSYYHELDSRIPIIRFGDSLGDLKEFYTTFKPNLDNPEIVLDLRSSSSSIIYNKLRIMAEISWTNSNKRSFDELKMNFEGKD